MNCSCSELCWSMARHRCLKAAGDDVSRISGDRAFHSRGARFENETLCHFSCSVKVNFNRHNLAKLRKKRELLFSQIPSEKKTGLATCEWPSISLRQALATSTRRCGQMRGKFDRHLYCCTEADLAVRSESALRPPLFFLFTTPYLDLPWFMLVYRRRGRWKRTVRNQP